jgi:hypothetical protein
MPEKKMWVKWEDGADLSQSRKEPGAFSPLTRDGENNLGHVTLSDVGEDEDFEPIYIYDDDDDDGSSHSDSDDPSELEELLGALVALAVIAAAQKAAPHLKRWWNEQALPFLKGSQQRLAKGRSAKHEATAAESSTLELFAPTESSQEVFTALEEYRASMSSAEARDRLVAALVARLFSEEQLRILRDARIEDEGPAFELASAMETLAPQQLGESVALMLETNPSWPDDQTLAELERVLGRGGQGDVAYVPVHDELRERRHRLRADRLEISHREASR